MTDQLSLDLVRKGLAADQIVLTVGYDHTGVPKDYEGKMEVNHYGKKVPKSAHGSVNLGRQTASTAMFINAAMELYDRIVDSSLLVRRMYVAANHVIRECDAREEETVQYTLFDDVEAMEEKRKKQTVFFEREKHLQKALLSIKDKYGKNAILKGMNFEDGATARERNREIGGHRA